MNKITCRIVRVPTGIFESDQVGQMVVPKEYRDRSALRDRRVWPIKPVRFEGSPFRIPTNRFAERPRKENFIRRRPSESGSGGHLKGSRADRTFRGPQPGRIRSEEVMKHSSPLLQLESGIRGPGKWKAGK